MRQVGASLRENVIAAIKELAAKERRSFSEIVGMLLDEALEKRKTAKGAK